MTYIYALIAIAAGAIGGLIVHAVDNGRVARAQEALAAYKQEVATQVAADANAAREALQTQVDEAHKRDQENDQTLQNLHAKLAESNRLRDQSRSAVRSLLNNAAKASCGGGVPKNPDQSGIAGTGTSSGIDTVADACGDLAKEDSDNADALDALIKQTKGNL